MNKEQALSKIKELEKEIKELKKKIGENKKGRWIPEKGENYHIVGYGRSWQYENIEGYSDKDIFGAHKVFRTEEEAEFELERQKVLRKMEEFEYHFTKEEWENADIEKCHLCFDVSMNEIIIDFNCSIMRDIIYFESEDDARACIKDIGEKNLKKYYFCIGLE